MNKTFWAVIAIIVVLFGGILLLKGNKANAPSSGPNSSNAQPTNHVSGQGQTGVVLVEYGDYQCPFCGEYYPLVKQVASTYQQQITFQFRNLPLLQIHRNAFAAARAAEAASLQGKFWEMHDLLYENQQTWGESSGAQDYFNGYAQQLGLNMTQFKLDFASSKVNNSINADIAAFNKTGQEMSTPTFFLDGKKITPTSVEAFNKLIDAEIAAKQKKS